MSSELQKTSKSNQHGFGEASHSERIRNQAAVDKAAVW